jgi:hypothetical protein
MSAACVPADRAKAGPHSTLSRPSLGEFRAGDGRDMAREGNIHKLKLVTCRTDGGRVMRRCCRDAARLRRRNQSVPRDQWTKVASVAVNGVGPDAVGGTDVADDKTNIAPQDAELISLTEDYEIAYWRKRFGVSDDRLAEAVHRVGISAAAVEAHLKR